jgi:hypothetical protein
MKKKQKYFTRSSIEQFSNKVHISLLYIIIAFYFNIVFTKNVRKNTWVKIFLHKGPAINTVHTLHIYHICV